MLRSAALRGLCAARHTLRLTYACALSREPEVAVVGLAFLRLTVKNYAHLLGALAASASREFSTTGQSGWIFFFNQGPNPAQLAREMAWISAFYAAAANEGFSLDAARPFMRQGADFFADASRLEMATSRG